MDEGGKDLYEVLGVTKDASQADIKKAYYKLALQLHPDKNPGDEESASKFQALQRIYAVLGDTEKRAIYDETGSLQDCEELVEGFGAGRGGAAFAELYRYYSGLYRKVEEDDIAAFARSYRGSVEEKADLLRHYTECRGDMVRVFEWVILSRPDVDAHRFMETVDAAIEAGEVERFKAYTKWAKATAAKPPPSVDPLAPEPSGGGSKAGGKKGGKKASGSEGALVEAILGRGESRMAATLAALEAKYGGSKTSSGKKRGRNGGGDSNGVAGSSRGGDHNSSDQDGGGAKKRSGGKKRAAAVQVVESDDDVNSESHESGDECGEPTEEEFEAARRRLEERRAAASGGGGGGGKAGSKGKGATAKGGDASGCVKKRAAGGKKNKA